MKKSTGDVLAESRGGREDMQLKSAYQHILKSGTLFHSKDFFQMVLTSAEIKLKPKKANIAGTQIADILAHPSKQEVLLDHKIITSYEEKFGIKIRDVITEKYNRHPESGKVEGYGKVLLK